MTTEIFTKDDYKLIIDALWKRQRCFIAGDKMKQEIKGYHCFPVAMMIPKSLTNCRQKN